ncbi:hypothetical protein J7K86_00875 [bacterium]|nr:hypothetical protein [bacterium]
MENRKKKIIKKQKNNGQTKIKAIRIVLIFIFVFIFGCLIYRNFAPKAIVKYNFNLKDNSEMIIPLSPIEETNFLVKDGLSYLQLPELVMKTDRVRFGVKLPNIRPKKAAVKIRFKSDNPEFKMAMREDPKFNWQYRLLDNKILNNLDWEKIQEGNLLFWQKYKNYDSIQELIDRPSRDQVIAQYFYEINKNFRIKDYMPKDEETTIDCGLRGSHSFYTYIKDEPINFTFEKQDMNMYEGADEGKIEIYNNENQLVYQMQINDDGITDDSKNKKEPQTFVINLPDMEEGVYRIDLINLSQGNDYLINKIVTKQHLLVFGQKVFCAKPEPFNVYTGQGVAEASTLHSSAFQDVEINDSDKISVDERNKKFRIDLNKEINKIYSPKGDLIIRGDGYFSFFPDSYFNPRPYNTVEFSNDVDLDNIDYIIANYEYPREVNNWLEQEVSFDLTKTQIIDNTLNFVLEAPGLKASNNEIIIGDLEIDLEK